MYWPGCYRPQVGLRGTGLAATGAGWPGGTTLATAAQRGYWPCRYSPQDRLGVLACLLQAPCWPGYWPGCYKLQVGLGVLAWLLHATGWPEGYWPGWYRPLVGLRGTGLAATGSRLAWGTGLAGAAHMGCWPGC